MMNNFENPPRNPDIRIAECEDLESLCQVLNDIGSVQGSGRAYAAEELVGYIESAQKEIKNLIFLNDGGLAVGDKPLPLMTRTFNLRGKVFELLKKEKEALKESTEQVGEWIQVASNSGWDMKNLFPLMSGNPENDMEEFDEFLKIADAKAREIIENASGDEYERLQAQYNSPREDGGIEVEFTDRRGKKWRVRQGAYQGSGGRTGFSKIKPV